MRIKDRKKFLNQWKLILYKNSFCGTLCLLRKNAAKVAFALPP